MPLPGNRKFDFGSAILAERVAQARFPVFAASLRDAYGQPLPGLRDNMLVTLRGVRVSLVGIALADTPEKAHQAISSSMRCEPE